MANYSAKPNVTTDLWQYTRYGRVSGISGNVDLNKVVDSSAVNSWYTNGNTTTTSNYYTSVTAGQTVKAKRAFYEYSSANYTKSKRVAKIKAGKSFKVKAIVKSSNGTPRIQLSNGNYITANKTYVTVK
ncbi:DUF5776 domain-containing protein [Secundilactobacillus oryzae]|uniref:DUF5776 domain-containing protein n=1 Tax=Secundilactobacillus oryzae TaxID=1202668 RepID=UPI0034E1F0E3